MCLSQIGIFDTENTEAPPSPESWGQTPRGLSFSRHFRRVSLTLPITMAILPYRPRKGNHGKGQVNRLTRYKRANRANQPKPPRKMKLFRGLSPPRGRFGGCSVEPSYAESSHPPGEDNRHLLRHSPRREWLVADRRCRGGRRSASSSRPTAPSAPLLVSGG